MSVDSDILITDLKRNVQRKQLSNVRAELLKWDRHESFLSWVKFDVIIGADWYWLKRNFSLSSYNIVHSLWTFMKT